MVNAHSRPTVDSRLERFPDVFAVHFVGTRIGRLVVPAEKWGEGVKTWHWAAAAGSFTQA
jgi:hypothetical protein